MAAAVGIVMSALSMSQSAAAGEKAKAAGEEGARSILAETAQNIQQTKKTQAQTLGLAKAVAAASGVSFDASKIAGVKFTEGGLSKQIQEREKMKTSWGEVIATEMGYKEEFELGSGEQIAGEEEGDSTFTYLREMKKEFAKDIGWQYKQGRSRARVARLGGQVSYAQSRASVYQQGASTAQSGYNWWKSAKTSSDTGTE